MNHANAFLYENVVQMKKVHITKSSRFFIKTLKLR